MRTWSCAEAAALDAWLQSQAGIPAPLLMENAGAALADRIRRRAGERNCRRVLVVAGPGNNGGDGLVAARQLLGELDLGVVLPLGRPREDPASPAFLALRAAESLAVPTAASLEPAALGPEVLVVDALFGTGLSRPLSGTAAEVVAAITAAEAPVLAVDIPSGLDGDRGVVLGAAVRADWTLTFVGPKHGFVRGVGPEHCGEVEVAGIGVSTAFTEAWLDRHRSEGGPPA